jgi:hypothetical protein
VAGEDERHGFLKRGLKGLKGRKGLKGTNALLWA